MIPLKKNYWGRFINENLEVLDNECKIDMINSDGKGLPLLIHKGFGADLIKFTAGKGVEKHIHPGSHILIVFSGEGKLGYYEETHLLTPGLIYLIPENVPHSIRAETDLVLMAIGNDHKSVNSNERMTLTNKIN